MAEDFEFSPAGAQDVNFGFGEFNTPLPDGTTADLEKINLSHLLEPNTVAFSATPIFDLTDGQLHSLTLTGNVTSSTIVNDIDAVPIGAVIMLLLIQDATGGRSFAWPADVVGASPAMVSKIASSVTIARLIYTAAGWVFMGPTSRNGRNVRLIPSLRDLEVADFALHANWGNTASVGTVSGSDHRGRFTVTSAGTGQGANPTVTLTFKDSAWPAAPFVVVVRNGGSQPTVLPTWTVSTTQLVVTFAGTPISAQSYTYEFIVMG